MKYTKILLGCLLFFPVGLSAEPALAGNASPDPAAAQTFVYARAEWQMPADIYEAFLKLPALKEQQKTLQTRGADLTEQEKTDKARYEQLLKGSIMVEVGHTNCKPCRLLVYELSKSNANEKSLLAQWQSKGGRFYQLDSLKDLNSKSEEKLVTLWNARSVPVLLFFKDGEQVARLNGMNAQNPEQTLAPVRQYIASVK